LHEKKKKKKNFYRQTNIFECIKKETQQKHVIAIEINRQNDKFFELKSFYLIMKKKSPRTIDV
jgi:hypothetical protein